MNRMRREDSLSFEDRQEIDRICTRFEDQWLAGCRPTLEPYLRQIYPAARAVLLHDLLLVELEYRRSLREQPCEDDYLARFPQWKGIVRSVFGEAYQRAVAPRFVPGSSIGRYQVGRVLGSGAFAVVYLARDPQLQRDVAIKVPHRYLLSEDCVRQQFLAEARTIAKLRHSRIVSLYHVDELEDGTIYLVMQHVPGTTLREVLRTQRLAPDEACAIAARVADVMAAAHCAGVYHRDLKPGNILLDESHEPHVCDFGLAINVADQPQRRGELAGTLAYMAPEQLRGESHLLDGRADVWSLGAILYEMLTGCVPFEGLDREELIAEIEQRDPRPLRQINPSVTRHQEQICLRCLARKAASRYATAADLADDLRRVEPTSGGRTLQRTSLLAIVALLTLLIGMFYPRPTAIVPTPRIPLTGTVDLVVWGTEDDPRQGLCLDAPAALPLRHGDRVRVDAQLNQPGYVYLLWIEVQGTLLPLYPWRQGHWDRTPATETPHTALALPPALSQAWPTQVRCNGMETLLLLARSSPLPETVDLRELLRNPPPRPAISRLCVASYQDRQFRVIPASAAHGRDRHPLIGRVDTLHDPLLDVHGFLVQQLCPHFDLIYAVSFPVTNQEANETQRSTSISSQQP